MHKRVPFNPNASQNDNLNVMVLQPDADREHMLILKTAVESLHERLEQQERVTDAHEQRHGEQAAVNPRAFMEHA